MKKKSQFVVQAKSKSGEKLLKKTYKINPRSENKTEFRRNEHLPIAMAEKSVAYVCVCVCVWRWLQAALQSS